MFNKSKTLNASFEEAPPRVNEVKRIIKTMFRRWVVILGTVIILALIITAIFAPYIAPYDPNKQDLSITLLSPSTEHLLGTDEVGRDVLSRIIYGSRISIMVGLIVTGIAGILGVTLGLIAGYFNRVVNNIIMRIIDAMMSLPSLVLALAIGAALGGGLKNVMISLGIALIPGYCRLIHAQVLAIKEQDYISAVKSFGSSNPRILLAV